MNDFTGAASIAYAELDCVCFVLIALFGGVGWTFMPRSGRRINPLYAATLVGYGLYLLADAAWAVGVVNGTITMARNYVFNSIYFTALTLASFFWFLYASEQMNLAIVKKPLWVAVSAVPTVFLLILCTTASVNGKLFYVNSDMVYQRGPWFVIFMLTHYGYFVLPAIHAFFAAHHRTGAEYNRTISYASYMLPILLFSLLQTGMSTNFYCLGYAFSTLVLFVYDLMYSVRMQHRREKTQENVISSLAKDYTGVLLLNLDTGEQEFFYRGSGYVDQEEVDEIIDYTEREKKFAEDYVYPEDKEKYIQAVDKERLLSELEKDDVFAFTYRMMVNGRPVWQENTYMKREGSNRSLVILGMRDISDLMAAQLEQDAVRKIVEERTAELNDKNRALNRVTESVLDVLGNIVESRDEESGEHIRRVRGFTYILAQEVKKRCPEYGITDEVIHRITSSASLHDVGKIAIPDSILLKRGSLSFAEYEVMKTHCDKGCEIIKRMGGFWDDEFLTTALDICRAHHEKWDGRGYPRGLKGDEIPIAAQIVSVADCFDALTSERCYKPPYPAEQAMEMILGGECGAYSQKMLECIAACREAFAAYADNPTDVLDDDLSRDTDSVVKSEVQQKTLYRSVQILNEEGDAGEAIQQLLQRLTEYYMADRTTLYSVSTDETVAHADFEWCAPGVVSEKDNRREMPFTDILAHIRSKMVEGIFYLDSHEKLDSNLAFYPMFREQNIRSLLTAPLYDENALSGFIALDNPRRPPEDTLLLRTMASLIRSELYSHARQNAAIHKYGLENELFRRAILDNAQSYFQANLTADRFNPPLVENVNGEAIDCSGFFGKTLPPYSEGIRILAERIVAEDYADSFREQLSPAFLIGQFRAGNRVCEFTAKIFTDSMGWHFRRYVNYLYKDEETGYILIMCVATAMHSSEQNGVLDGSRILLVDDNEFNRDLSRDLLEKEGVAVTEAADGQEAINLVRAGEKFDIILMDIVMPNVNGMEATAAIRAMEKTKEDHIPIIALTAEGNEAQVEDMLRAGADDCMSKPLVISDLNRILMTSVREHNATIQERLRETIRLANTDTLTGVKNVTAYTDKVAEITERMHRGDRVSFAVVMCDLNYLKQVNDTFGHDKGDIYIKNACRILNDVFCRSSIYRIGGDEFLVMMQGPDYRIREQLLEKLAQRVSEAEKIEAVEDGRASFAFGMATFNPTSDLSVSETVKRADTAMYEAKKDARR